MTKIIVVEGMSCEHCVNHVKEALTNLNGIAGVDVNLATGKAVLETTLDIIDDDIKIAINDAGYEVVRIETA